MAVAPPFPPSARNPDSAPGTTPRSPSSDIGSRADRGLLAPRFRESLRNDVRSRSKSASWFRASASPTISAFCRLRRVLTGGPQSQATRGSSSILCTSISVILADWSIPPTPQLARSRSDSCSEPLILSKWIYFRDFPAFALRRRSAVCCRPAPARLAGIDEEALDR